MGARLCECKDPFGHHSWVWHGPALASWVEKGAQHLVFAEEEGGEDDRTDRTS